MKNYSKKCEEENSPILKIKRGDEERRKDFPLLCPLHGTACIYLCILPPSKLLVTVHQLFYLEFGTQQTRGKREPNGVEGGEGTNPTAQIRRRLCLQDLGDTYFWSGARQSCTECQPQKWDTGLRIQGNGQQAGISIHSLHWPHPQDLITARAKQIHHH